MSELSLRLPEGTWARQDQADSRPLEWLIYANDLDVSGERRELAMSLKLELTRVHDGFEVFAPVLELGGFGADARSALDDFASTIIAMWDEFSVTPEAELHSSAIACRERLRPYLAHRA